MNSALIDNWNAVVKPTDMVYHLGDFAMGPFILFKDYCSKLNGHKVLVRGNHDRSATKMVEVGFSEVYNNILTLIDGKRVWMQHIPVGNDPYQAREGGRTYAPENTLPSRPHDIWLCGHVHEKFARVENVINVGVDVRNYRPVTFEELINSEAR